MTASEPTESKSDSNDSKSKSPKKSRLVRFVALCVALVTLSGAYVGWWVPRQLVRRAERALHRLHFDQAGKLLADYPSWGLELGRVHFNRARLSRHQSGYAAALEHLRIARAARFDDAAIARERALLQIQNGQPASTQTDRLDEFCSASAERSLRNLFCFYKRIPTRRQASRMPSKSWIAGRKNCPKTDAATTPAPSSLQRAGKEVDAMAFYGKAVTKSPQLVDAYLAQARTHATHWRYGQGRLDLSAGFGSRSGADEH